MAYDFLKTRKSYCTGATNSSVGIWRDDDVDVIEYERMYFNTPFLSPFSIEPIFFSALLAGKRQLPSCVAFSGPSQCVVGDAAKAKPGKNTYVSFYHFQRQRLSFDNP
jgi:molecular chaperone DnaK (HSP70)